MSSYAGAESISEQISSHAHAVHVENRAALSASENMSSSTGHHSVSHEISHGVASAAHQEHVERAEGLEASHMAMSSSAGHESVSHDISNRVSSEAHNDHVVKEEAMMNMSHHTMSSGAGGHNSVSEEVSHAATANGHEAHVHDDGSVHEMSSSAGHYSLSHEFSNQAHTSAHEAHVEQRPVETPVLVAKGKKGKGKKQFVTEVRGAQEDVGGGAPGSTGENSERPKSSSGHHHMPHIHVHMPFHHVPESEGSSGPYGDSLSASRTSGAAVLASAVSDTVSSDLLSRLDQMPDVAEGDEEADGTVPHDEMAVVVNGVLRSEFADQSRGSSSSGGDVHPPGTTSELSRVEVETADLNGSSLGPPSAPTSLFYAESFYPPHPRGPEVHPRATMSEVSSSSAAVTRSGESARSSADRRRCRAVSMLDDCGEERSERGAGRGGEDQRSERLLQSGIINPGGESRSSVESRSSPPSTTRNMPAPSMAPREILDGSNGRWSSVSITVDDFSEEDNARRGDSLSNSSIHDSLAHSVVTRDLGRSLRSHPALFEEVLSSAPTRGGVVEDGGGPGLLREAPLLPNENHKTLEEGRHRAGVPNSVFGVRGNGRRRGGKNDHGPRSSTAEPTSSSSATSEVDSPPPDDGRNPAPDAGRDIPPPDREEANYSQRRFGPGPRFFGEGRHRMDGKSSSSEDSDERRSSDSEDHPEESSSDVDDILDFSDRSRPRRISRTPSDTERIPDIIAGDHVPSFRALYYGLASEVREQKSRRTCTRHHQSPPHLGLVVLRWTHEDEYMVSPAPYGYQYDLLFCESIISSRDCIML